MRRNPLYIFKNEGSTGIADIPLNSIVQILESSNGRVLIVELLSKANLTVGATIAHLLLYPDQYNVLSDGTAGGELVKYRDDGNPNIGYKLDGVDKNLYGPVGLNSVDLSSQFQSTTFDRGATGGLSFTTGLRTLASGEGSTAFGIDTTASGDYSFVFGTESNASGRNSFSGGLRSHASGEASIALGRDTLSTGYGSSAFGILSVSQGLASYAEGYNTHAGSNYSHAEGFGTIAGGLTAHAEGHRTEAKGFHTHSEGYKTKAGGVASHAEGESTISEGRSSHVEGIKSESIGDYSHAEGDTNISIGVASHAEGTFNTSDGDYSHVEGRRNASSGLLSRASGQDNIASGEVSSVSGKENVASGNISSAGGYRSKSDGLGSLAWGTNVTSSGSFAIATGGFSTAVGNYSQAGGFWTQAIGRGSIAGGYKTAASGSYSVALGTNTLSQNTDTVSIGTNTVAINASMLAAGRFNTSQSGTILEVGIGVSSISRKNALEIYTDGSLIVPGLETSMIIDDKSLVTKEYIDGAGGAGTGNWGSISGNIEDQTDLAQSLNNKEDFLEYPDNDGDILISDTAGNRFWAPNNASGAPQLQDFDSMDQQTHFTVHNVVFLNTNVYADGILIRRDQYTISNNGTDTTIIFFNPVSLNTWIAVEYYIVSYDELMANCKPLPFDIQSIIGDDNQTEFVVWNSVFEKARVIRDGLVLRRTEYVISDDGIHTTITMVEPTDLNTRVLIEYNLNETDDIFDVVTTSYGTTFTLDCANFINERLFVDGILMKRDEYSVTGTTPGTIVFTQPLNTGQWILVEHKNIPEPLTIVHDYITISSENTFTIYNKVLEYVRAYQNGVLVDSSDVCVSSDGINTKVTLGSTVPENTWIALEYDFNRYSIIQT